MNLTKLSIAVSSLFSLLLPACSPIYYRANPQNVPLLLQKGDLSLSFGCSGASDFLGPGVDFQYAHALTNHIGLIGNVNYFKGSVGDYKTLGYLIEGGTGYFIPFARNFVVECYGGIGIGNIDNAQIPSGSMRIRGDISIHQARLFLQPSIGFHSNSIVVALSSRLCGLHYYAGAFDLGDSGYVNDYHDLTSQPWIGSLESALTVKFGSPKVKVFYQLMETMPLTNNAQLFPYQIMVMMGFQIRL